MKRIVKGIILFLLFSLSSSATGVQINPDSIDILVPHDFTLISKGAAR